MDVEVVAEEMTEFLQLINESERSFGPVKKLIGEFYQDQFETYLKERVEVEEEPEPEGSDWWLYVVGGILLVLVVYGLYYYFRNGIWKKILSDSA